ncbi:MAG: hypothetical protein ACK4QP_03510 [Pseudorhizobium sp.]
MKKPIAVVRPNGSAEIEPISSGCVPQEKGPVDVKDEFLAQRQTAEISLMFTKDAGFKARAEISSGGLLTIGALVSSILLATTVLVHVAVRDGKRRRWL